MRDRCRVVGFGRCSLKVVGDVLQRRLEDVHRVAKPLVVADRQQYLFAR